MKKVRFISLALVAAIMLMGAGYAIWSDQTFATATVKTGLFDMAITNARVRTGDNELQNEKHNPRWHSYDWTHGKVVWFNANEAVVEFTDLYPGGMVQIDLLLENKGTLPAKLKSATVEFLDGNEALFNLLRIQTSWKADIDGDGNQDTWSHVENWQYWRPIQAGLNKLVEDTRSRNLVIEPGGWFSLGELEEEEELEEGCIKIKLDSSADNSFQQQYCKFKITFNWEQWAADPNDNPYDGYGGDGDIPGIEPN
ncbi:MAG: hypothetical protein GX754_02925 [Clostridiaceae bacterium]|nr:hypothetical protein [Clostridiaceae bacterium]